MYKLRIEKPVVRFEKYILGDQLGIYNFKNLSSYDFEILVKDLLQKKLSYPLENFKTGRDNGIDLRYISTKNKIIIQCKHYVESKFSNLKSVLKSEKQKISKLKPTRYIIVTSLGLTPLNKDEIKNILEPYVIKQEDILDAESINSLLRDYPDIEKCHFKLWLSSTAVLDKLLHSSIYNKSEIKKEEILKKIKLYVECNSFFSALKLLNEFNYCIISGEPGIGKTTLAKIISIRFIEKDFKFYEISNIKEAFSLLKHDESQIFYYDDFLGNTSYVDKEEDSDLINFLDFIKLKGNKKLILTSREYIYNQAISNNELFNRYNLHKCIIRQGDYHKIAKAKILYNHLYFSGLKKEYFQNIISNKGYLKIINHRNYSPRIIEWMTNILNFSMITSDKYLDIFIQNLNNPKEIWRYAFENHITEMSKYILIILSISSEKIQFENLKQILKTWYFAGKSIPAVTFQLDFINSLKELENTFIKIEIHNNLKLITFQNPSIKDFLEFFLSQNIDIIEDFYNSKIVLWDQKLSVLIATKTDKHSKPQTIVDLSKKFKFKIIKECIINLDLPSINVNIYDNVAISRYSSEEDKILLCMRIILKNYNDNFKELLDDLVNLFKVNFLQKKYLKETDYYILQILPAENFDNDIVKKLKTLITNVDTIEELRNLIELDKKFKIFNQDFDVSQIIDESFQNIDADIDDLYELNSLKEDIEKICDFFEVNLPISYYDIDEKIDELEEQEAYAEDMAADAYHDRIVEDRIIEKRIDDIFDTLNV